MTERAFWLTTKLQDMTSEQWESLCDRCGKCCHIAGRACPFLGEHTGLCTVYSRRSKVDICYAPTIENMKSWPSSCSYRLVAEGKDLPEWHHLKTGDHNSIHEAAASSLGLRTGVLSAKLEDE